MLNRVMLIGNLGRDPEVRFTANGKAVARFTLATSEAWTDGDGKRQERTEWHTIVVWGKQAEACGQHLAKGRQAYVEGAIRTRQYEKDGAKRYVTEIVAQRVQFLGGGKELARGTEGRGAGAAREPGVDDDIPF